MAADGGTVATWQRLEPHARTTDLDVGLAAEIADPLWMIGRQLQLGELTGVDGGTPILVDVQVSWSALTELRAEGSAGDGTTVPISAASPPIEALVERQPELPIGEADGRWSARLRAGRDLARRLRAGTLGSVADALGAHPSTTFTGGAGDDGGDADGQRYRALLAGRTIDAAPVLALIAGPGLPADVVGGLSDDQRAELTGHLDAWSAAMSASWGTQTADADRSPAWVDDRLGYSFSVAAPALPPSDAHFPGDADEIVLRAARYDGSGLDWYSLDRADPATGSLGATTSVADEDRRRRRSVLATPLTFRGAPADRFWEFEDAATSLGFGTAGPTDLVRLVATEFAVVFSTDWLVAPVQIPAGTVATIDWVVVRDTFGVATLVGDRATQFGDGAGRQFQPADEGAGNGDHPVLVVLPSSLAPLRSTPRERVSFQRDELANLAWAIEHIVEGATGRGITQALSMPSLDVAAPAVADPFELVWRLATPVPEPWIPLVPGTVAEAADPTQRLMALLRSRLFDSIDDQARASRSRLLAHLSWLRDEEVTGSGVEVTVLDQLARTSRGGAVVWRGGERRPGRGGASSGLRYDDTSPR
jgi:hypothetical protein